MSASPLPTFLVIGARKAGTTSLYHYLRSHPDVFMPEEKEIHFFSDNNWGKGLEWYRSLFTGAGGATAIGEASTGYSHYPMFPHVPERIAKTIPDVRLVYVLRHPLDRLVASWRHNVYEFGEGRGLDQAMLDFNWYVSGSMYSMQIERYLEHFDPSRLLVITSEALRDRRAETLRTVYAFLGVDDSWSSQVVQEEFNRGAAFRVDRAVTARLRRTAVFRLAARVVPASLRERVGRLGSRPLALPQEALELSDTTRKKLLEQLRPDLERLPTYVGEGFHCWGLLDEAAAHFG